MHGPPAERSPWLHTHTPTHKLEDAQALGWTLGCRISVMSEPKLLRSQAETLSCSGILLFSSDSVLSLVFTIILICPSLVSPLSLVFSYPSLPLFVSPSLLCWCCISQRDRLKQMPSWETGYVCACVHCLHKLTHRRHAHKPQLPTDGGGIREGESDRER